MDGRSIILVHPYLSGDTLFGGLESSARTGKALSPGAFPVSSVKGVAVRKTDPFKSAGLVVGITVVLIAAAAAVTSDGSFSGGGLVGDGGNASCPMIYSWDGHQWRLDSGTFGGAITRGAARTDLDNLDYLAPDGEQLRLRVANELNETDHLDGLAILAVDHPIAMGVAPDGAGRIHTIGATVAPTEARDFAGRDVLARIDSADGWAWESSLSGRDPERDYRDGVELSFPRSTGDRDARLVLDAHNTPWATYMLGTLIAAHGRETASWYDSLDANPGMLRQLGGMLAREGFLSVAVLTRDGWEPQGFVWEAGPEVMKRQVHVLDLSRVEGDTVRVRLESAPAFWRLDRVAIDYSAEDSIVVRELAPKTARDENGRDLRATLTAFDGDEYTIETGGSAEVTFDSPPVPEGMARSYILRSSGWYRIHTPEYGDPDRELLTAVLTQPRGGSKFATERLNRALAALTPSRDGAER
ncbi:MAG: hypothetical protein ABI587_10185 [Gemmatimonadales bacterium]